MKSKIKNSIGMFDLIKGITMFFMVFVHTITLFPAMFIYRYIYEHNQYTAVSMIAGRLLIAVFTFFVMSLIPALFIVSGYGFRKVKIKVSIKQQFKALIWPYLITSFFTVCLHFCTHFALYRYFKGSVIETIRIAAGFALGLPCTSYYGDIKIFSCGPIWFLLALMWAWCIFNTIINVFPDKLVGIITLTISTIGWLLSFTNTIPYCFSQGLISVLGIYIGYYLKKNKVYTKSISRKTEILFTCLFIVPNLVLRFLGFYDGMADSLYPLGIIGIIEDFGLGIFIIYIFLHINRVKCHLFDFIRLLGRNSMIFFCVHTFEMMGFPWYYFADSWKGNPDLGGILLFSVRFTVDIVLCLIVLKIKKILNTFKERII